MTQQNTAKPDAFKAVLEAAKSELGRPELAHQSLGRPLSAPEDALAEALMEIYGAGLSGPDAVARALTEKGVASPVSGDTSWTAESVARDIAALNADLDAAYDENGFGG